MANNKTFEEKKKWFYEDYFRFTRGEKSYSLENLWKDREKIVPEINTDEERFLRMGLLYLSQWGSHQCERLHRLKGLEPPIFQQWLDLKKTEVPDFIQPVLEAIANYRDKEEERALYDSSLKRAELVVNPPKTTDFKPTPLPDYISVERFKRLEIC